MNDTGGPAFPTKNYAAIQPLAEGYSEGMSLRDWFAGKAMTTMFYPAIMESIRTDKDLDCGQVAAFAYQMADALLKERIKQ